jgi:ribose-phosphate pyrophosphokinase
MILVANHSSLHLASRICELGPYTLVTSDTRLYNSKEMEVSIPSFDANECVLIIGYDGDSNLTFIELLLHAQKLKNMGVSKVHLCMPYMIYSRQCQDKSGSFGVLSLVINMINQCQFASVSIVDPHDPEIFSQINNFVEIPHNSLFGDYTKDAVFVSPDAGSRRRLKFFLNAGCKGFALNKIRKSPSEVYISGECEDFNRKDCIILDDIVDSANTVCRAAEFLKKCGAQQITGYISHNLLNHDAVRRIEASPIDYLVLSDTSAPKPFVLDCEKIKIVSAATVIAKHLQSII